MEKEMLPSPLETHPSWRFPADSEKSEESNSTALRSTAASIKIEPSKDLASTTPKPETKPPEIKPPELPDGGLVAWLQVIGCFFCWFNCWGLINAFGVFQTHYQTILLPAYSPSTISWIGAVQSFLLVAVGILAGPLHDAGYFGPILWAGSALVVAGHMMLSLCDQYWQIMLAQGVVVGVGAGCLFIPSVVILPQYFVRRRALANGVAAAGSSMGGVVYPILVHKLLPTLGFPWAARVLGFVALGTCAISIAVLRVRVKATRQRVLFDFKALTEAPFAFLTLSFLFALMGLYIPAFYITTFAVEKGIVTGDLSAYLLPILNAGGVLGRIIPNFFADKTGPFNILTPFLAMAGVMSLVWIVATNVGSLIAVALIYGFFSGAILSLPPIAIVSLCPSLAVIGTRFGTASAIASIGILIGTPISGAILGSARNYVGLQVFSGALLLTAAIFCGASRVSKAGLQMVKV